MRLDTERLRLVPVTAELLDALADRPRAERLLDAAVPAGFPDPDLVDLLRVYGRSLAEDPAELGYGPWLAVARAERVVAGSGGFVGRPGADGTIELGYGLLPEQRGRGYATELARALVEWGLAQPGVRRVVARCDPGNAPSIRVLQKLGFRRTGEADGLLLWESG